MAMPTSAAASAGASLTPSPAIATTRPAALQRCTTALFCVGQHLGLDLGDAEPARHRLGRGAVVAGQHDDAHALGLQRRQRRGRRRLDRIGDGDHAREPCRRPRRRSRSRRRGASLRPALAAPRRRCRARRGTWRCRAQPACPRPRRARPCRSASRSPVTAASAMPRSFAARTIASASGCSLARSTLAASRSNSVSSKPAAGTIAVTAGLPSVSVPVLSTTSVSTFSMRSSASAFLISTPACAPRPTPTMIDIGVARPSAHGQAMISTATAATSAIGEARLGPEHRQAHERQQRDRDHGRHEPARRPGRPAAGSARGCAAPRATICTICASMVSRPTLLGSHHEARRSGSACRRSRSRRPPS